MMIVSIIYHCNIILSNACLHRFHTVWIHVLQFIDGNTLFCGCDCDSSEINIDILGGVTKFNFKQNNFCNPRELVTNCIHGKVVLGCVVSRLQSMPISGLNLRDSFGIAQLLVPKLTTAFCFQSWVNSRLVFTLFHSLHS